MDDPRDETETREEPSGPTPARPESGQDAIRGAFLARAATAEASAPGLGAADDGSAATLRSAFLKHLAPARGGAVVGDESSGDKVLRNVFAARIAPAAAPPATRTRATPAKKVARAAAKPARRAKPAAKKRAVASAPRRAKAKQAARPRRKTKGRTRR